MSVNTSRIISSWIVLISYCILWFVNGINWPETSILKSHSNLFDVVSMFRNGWEWCKIYSEFEQVWQILNGQWIFIWLLFEIYGWSDSWKYQIEKCLITDSNAIRNNWISRNYNNGSQLMKAVHIRFRKNLLINLTKFWLEPSNYLMHNSGRWNIHQQVRSIRFVLI